MKTIHAKISETGGPSILAELLTPRFAAAVGVSVELIRH
jgi:hypothetical protein